MARKHDPDVIILDVMMPDINGFEVCKTLKEEPETSSIPIIIVSALSKVESRIEAKKAGADEFLSRPHIREELLVRIRMLIQLKQKWIGLQKENDHLRQNAEMQQLMKDYELLDLSGKKLTTVPLVIFKNSNLRKLHLNRNKLTELPSLIGLLRDLEELHLKDNNLTSLPIEIKQLKNLKTLDLRGNSLSIPSQILEKYDDPKIILDHYFQHQNQQVFDEAKIVVLGQANAGKTSLINRLVFGIFDPNQKKTPGINIVNWTVKPKDRTVRLNIWDFGGQEIFHAIHQFFLTPRSLYLLLLDARQSESAGRLEYWIKTIESFGGDAPVIIVVNKIDEHLLELDHRVLQSKYPSIQDIVYTSCATNEGFDQLQKTVIEAVTALPYLQEEWSFSWFAIKEKLRTLKDDFIPYESYMQLCEEEGVNSSLEQRVLIQDLHDLGVILNFQGDPRLEDTHVLNPTWVSNGIFQILNADLPAKNQGVLEINQLEQILDKRTYPSRKYYFLLGMMEKFKICFSFTNQSDTYLFPSLLSNQEPVLQWGETKSLKFEYHYETLPMSIISQFIVVMHTYAHKNTYWRNGIVIYYEENKALIKADYEDRRISVWVRGDSKSSRRNLLSIIRAQFQLIHYAIPRLEVVEAVPLPNSPENTITYQELLNLEKQGIDRYFYAKINDWISVAFLLDGIEAPQKRNLPELRDKLMKNFSKNEIKDICFRLGIDHQNLQQETKNELAMELVLALNRKGRIQDLVQLCNKLNSNFEG